MKREAKLFNQYVKKFNLKDKRLMDKFHHSYRVMDFCKEIAISLNLNEHQIFIANLCGLLHDISRFKQIEKFDTFKDAKSFDHGDESVKILKSDNLIDKFVCDNKDQDLILKAIKNHNKYKIEDNLSDDELLYCKILRDADKLDIIKEQANSIDDGVYELNDKLLSDIYNKHLCNSINSQHNIDYVCQYLSFIFDLNFDYSFNYIKDNDIVNNKLNLLEANINIDKLKKFIKDYLNSYNKKDV